MRSVKNRKREKQRLRWPNKCPEVAGEDFAAEEEDLAGEGSEAVQAEVSAPLVFDRAVAHLGEPELVGQRLLVPIEDRHLIHRIDDIDHIIVAPIITALIITDPIITDDFGIRLGGMDLTGGGGSIPQDIGAAELYLF